MQWVTVPNISNISKEIVKIVLHDQRSKKLISNFLCEITLNEKPRLNELWRFIARIKLPQTQPRRNDYSHQAQLPVDSAVVDFGSCALIHLSHYPIIPLSNYPIMYIKSIDCVCYS